MNLLNKTARNKGFIALMLGFCLFISNTIQAQDVTWTGGGGDGNWNTAANWSTGVVPGTGLWIEIQAASSPVVTISSGTTVNVSKLNIAGDATGSAKLIIASGATLNVTQTSPSTGSTSGIALGVLGGTLENNGTLSATCSGASGTTGEAIRIGATAASSKLDNKAGSTLTASTLTGLAAGNTINFSSGTSTFTTNGTVNLNAAAGKYAINVSSGATATIDGAGFTLPTANLNLITQAGGGSALTIETGAALTSNGTSSSSNAILLNPSVGTATLTNKGTLNINGTTSSAIRMVSSGTAGLSTFDNQGTVTANITTGSTSSGGFNISGAFTYAIKNSGTMSLTNGLTAAPAFYSAGTTSSTVTVTNSGTLTLTGKANVAFGATTIVNNTGTITTNFAPNSGTVNNNTGGVLTFTSNASTSSATAIATTLNNSGTINTNTGSTLLTSITGTTTLNSGGTLSPGGSSGKGEMKISGATVALTGTLKIQASGTGTAGVDFDRITANTTNGGFSLSGVILDLTGTYTPSVLTTIAVIVANGTGPITGSAPTITNGTNWTVVVDNTAVPQRVNIVYDPALPVELVSFTATPLSKMNKLIWITATETNNKGFDIQRQILGDKWETLGFVNAQGKAFTYTFEDNTPLSISYYRLRQVDFDGKESYSKVVSVSQNKGGSLLITPNPASDKVQISVPNDVSSDIFITLYDLSGKHVLSQKSNAANTSIDVSNLAKGVYLMEVQSQKVIYREKLVRQ